MHSADTNNAFSVLNSESFLSASKDDRVAPQALSEHKKHKRNEAPLPRLADLLNGEVTERTGEEEKQGREEEEEKVEVQGAWGGDHNVPV